jgi:hypothetical protein
LSYWETRHWYIIVSLSKVFSNLWITNLINLWWTTWLKWDNCFVPVSGFPDHSRAQWFPGRTSKVTYSHFQLWSLQRRVTDQNQQKGKTLGWIPGDTRHKLPGVHSQWSHMTMCLTLRAQQWHVATHVKDHQPGKLTCAFMSRHMDMSVSHRVCNTCVNDFTLVFRRSNWYMWSKA